MTLCNRCGSGLVPDDSALIPALKCPQCFRVIPRTGVRPPKGDRRQLARALRAARRHQIAKGVNP